MHASSPARINAGFCLLSKLLTLLPFLSCVILNFQIVLQVQILIVPLEANQIPKKTQPLQNLLRYDHFPFAKGSHQFRTKTSSAFFVFFLFFSFLFSSFFKEFCLLRLSWCR